VQAEQPTTDAALGDGGQNGGADLAMTPQSQREGGSVQPPPPPAVAAEPEPEEAQVRVAQAQGDPTATDGAGDRASTEPRSGTRQPLEEVEAILNDLDPSALAEEGDGPDGEAQLRAGDTGDRLVAEAPNAATASEAVSPRIGPGRQAASTSGEPAAGGPTPAKEAQAQGRGRTPRSPQDAARREGLGALLIFAVCPYCAPVLFIPPKEPAGPRQTDP
jgi:hypothetical protein